MENPFQPINARLTNLEALTLEVLQLLRSTTTPADEVGGKALAREITGLSDARIYALVSERRIPHSKRGNRLFFRRSELLAWVADGNRKQVGGLDA